MFQYSDIIGQEAIKRQLREQIATQHVAHAQLFCGPEGAGKLPMALAFAASLLCHDPHGGEACGQCSSCRMVEKLTHPDLHFVFPVLKAKEVSDDYIARWREMLITSPYMSRQDWYDAISMTNQQPRIFVAESDRIISKLSLTAQQGGYKVMIIWMVELMGEEAANKLLKVLEEPPQQTVLILISSEPDKLLPTIRSRALPINFPALSEQEIATALQQRNALSPDDALRVAQQASGNFTRALSKLQTGEEEDQVFFDQFVSLMRLTYSGKAREMVQWSENVAEWGRERQKRFLEACSRFVQQNLLVSLRMEQLTHMTEAESAFARNFARFINVRNAEGLNGEFSLAWRDISRNVNARMVFFDLALHVATLIRRPAKA